MGTYNNNATHIYSVEIHVGIVDLHTLYPWPLHMLVPRYDAHAALLSFYMSQIVDYPFFRTLSFVHFDLDLLAYSNNDHILILLMNEYFWHIYITHNHT